MEWFSGDIAEAVKISKEKHVIFVVFIDGKTDGDSLAMQGLLANSAVVSKLSDSSRFLVIRIESDTDTYKQFAQIYRLVPVPSLFFIGEFGQPLEIVAGNVKTPELLLERIAVAEKAFHKDNLPSAAATTVPGSSSSSPLTSVPKKPAQPPPKPQRNDMEEQPTKDELERLKLKEERKREKEQDEEARRRVLEQIKADRLRRQGEEPIAVASKPAAVSPPVVPRNLPDMTRIQFRKPSGECLVDTFKSDGPFGDVWKYAKASLDIKDFVLATTMPPRREFSADHSDQTLIELNLAPSAVLLVIPLTKPSIIGAKVNEGGGVVATVTNLLFSLIWLVITPLMSLWNRIRGNNQPANRPEAPPRQVEEDVPPSNIGNEILQKRNLSRFNLGPSGSPDSHPQGSGAAQKKANSNIHRLTDYDSDDKDNNTYNGNSTQQM